MTEHNESSGEETSREFDLDRLFAPLRSLPQEELPPNLSDIVIANIKRDPFRRNVLARLANAFPGRWFADYLLGSLECLESFFYARGKRESGNFYLALGTSWATFLERREWIVVFKASARIVYPAVVTKTLFQSSWAFTRRYAVAFGLILSLALHGYWLLAPAPVPLMRGSVPINQQVDTLESLVREANRLNEANNPEEAIAKYRQALDRIASPLNELGWLLYAEKKGTPEEKAGAIEGVSLARLAVQFRPDKATYVDTLAALLCVIGEPVEAHQWMEKAAKLDPKEFRGKFESFDLSTCQ